MTPDQTERDELVKRRIPTPRTDKARRSIPSSVNDGADELIKEARKMERELAQLKALTAQQGAESVVVPRHSDDDAVDMFADAMKAKLAVKRSQGRSGWDDPEQCHIEYLYRLLWGHEKRDGQHIDVANLRMMIWHRENNTALLAASPAAKGGE